jgi:uncharacterized membrane protein YqhA
MPASLLRLVLSLRFIMLVASFGAGVGALLMLWQGSGKLAGAMRALAAPEPDGASPLALVMGSTDAFLFAVVLVIFAYAIAFGFVIDLDAEQRERLPEWMRISDVGQLKRTLIEVILVYLVVDFATDIAEGNGHDNWQSLVLPGAILLLAGALRLLTPENELRR